MKTIRLTINLLELSLLLFFAIPLELNAQIINFTGFEDFEDEEQFTQSSWFVEGFTVPWSNGFNSGRAFVDDEYALFGSKSLRIIYPEGTYGPQSNGAQAPLKVDGSDELYISYWLRFSDDFDWGGTFEGGKLPGLAGGANCSGCKECTGNNGFTARLMWRTEGKGVLYLYHMDKESNCGDDFTLQASGNDFYFQKGQWYNVIQRVKINTDNDYNGEVEVWINQEHALLLTGLRFVNNGGLVDNLYFSTFHGGGNSDWAPSNDCYIWFDNVVIANEAEDVFDFTGIEEVSVNAVNLFPNPVKPNSIINLEFNNDEIDYFETEWLNTSGEIILETKLNSYNTISVPDIPTGIYILRIRARNKLFHQKIIVN